MDYGAIRHGTVVSVVAPTDDELAAEQVREEIRAKKQAKAQARAEKLLAENAQARELRATLDKMRDWEKQYEVLVDERNDRIRELSAQVKRVDIMALTGLSHQSVHTITRTKPDDAATG